VSARLEAEPVRSPRGAPGRSAASRRTVGPELAEALVSRRIPIPAVWKSMVEMRRSDAMAAIIPQTRLGSAARPSDTLEEGRGGLGQHERGAGRGANLGRDRATSRARPPRRTRGYGRRAANPGPVDHHRRHAAALAVLDQMRHRTGAPASPAPRGSSSTRSRAAPARGGRPRRPTDRAGASGRRHLEDPLGVGQARGAGVSGAEA